MNVPNVRTSLRGRLLSPAKQRLDEKQCVIGRDSLLTLKLLCSLGESLGVYMCRTIVRILRQNFTGITQLLRGRSPSLLRHRLRDQLEGLNHIIAMILILRVGLIESSLVCRKPLGGNIEEPGQICAARRRTRWGLLAQSSA